ncbi:unnamed protein product [Ixodes pacificus]
MVLGTCNAWKGGRPPLSSRGTGKSNTDEPQTSSTLSISVHPRSNSGTATTENCSITVNKKETKRLGMQASVNCEQS